MNQWERWDKDWESERVRFPKMPLGSWPKRPTLGRRSTVTQFCSLWLGFAHNDGWLFVLLRRCRSSTKSSPTGSSELQIVSDHFPSSSVILQIYSSQQKSSLKDSVLLFRTWLYKTRDIYGIILPTHQVGIDSLTFEF